jgi:hypothetical protein
MTKTYHGSCECERVTYEATFDLSAGTFKCNCRICTKGRLWGAVVAPENLKVLSGEGELVKYWTGPVHHFCKHCGIKVFGRAKGPDSKDSAVVMLATLDDLDPRELARAPVHYFDGRHDRFDRRPEFTGHL